MVCGAPQRGFRGGGEVGEEGCWRFLGGVRKVLLDPLFLFSGGGGGRGWDGKKKGGGGKGSRLLNRVSLRKEEGEDIISSSQGRVDLLNRLGRLIWGR